MASKNLSRLLECNSIITYDVKFFFNNQFVGEPLTISAHKVILSAASDVFETQFYGEVQELGDEVTIVDASCEAFKAMIEFIYDKKHDWELEDLYFLSEMYYLGEKYNLEDLKIEVVDAVVKFQVSRANVLEVATLAEKQAHHPTLSKSLYAIAAKFLLNKFKSDINYVLKLFSEIEADPNDPTNSFLLHKLIITVNEIRPPSQSFCKNCKTNPCLNDKEPTRLNFVGGARIKIVHGRNYNSGINPIATTERMSRSKIYKFVGKKVTGYISCHFGRGSYFYKCK